MRTRKRLLVPLLIQACTADIVRPKSINHPEINSTALGQLALVGDFDSLSTFNYVGENSVLEPVVENDNLLSQAQGTWDYYLSASFADATVSHSCLLDNGVAILAGNFTHARDVAAAGIARLDLVTGSISSLGNISLTGAVQSLWCNHTHVYVGGNLQLGNGQGLGIWNDTSQSWQLPVFGGFPFGSQVRAITPIDNDTLLFGGILGDPLYGSSNNIEGTQELGLAAATISATDAATDPSNALCMSGSAYEANSGSVESVLDIDLGRTVTLSKISIANPDGNDGTSLFRIQTSPSNSIMNMSYTIGGETSYCDANCPLELGSNIVFSFVNAVGTRNLSISLLSYFGDHAAIQGIELYTDQGYVYANNELNSPLSCQDISLSNKAQLTGDWQSIDDYESATISTGSGLTETSIKYYPNITTSGNFTLNLWTPGCLSSGSCSLRGEVNVTVYPGPADEYDPVSVSIFQTNNEVKYDPVYTGNLVRTSSFDPYVEVAPMSGQQTPLELVASQLEVVLISADAVVEIGKLFEYSVSNYTEFSQNSAFQPVGNTTLNQLGNQLGQGSKVEALTVLDDTVYLGGNFSDASLIAYSTSNDSVSTISSEGYVRKLYTYMSNVFAISDYNAVYNVTDGYNNIYDKPVTDVSLFNLNGTGMLAFTVTSSNDTIDLFNLSSNAWYDGDSLVTGHISQTLTYNTSNFYFGSFRVANAKAEGAASVDATYQVFSLPFSFLNQTSGSSNSLSRREASQQGQVIKMGTFWDGANLLGGHFTANTSSGDTAQNLMVVNGSDSYGLATDGLDAQSTISSLAVYKNTLVLGGDLQGSYQNMAVYDLSEQKFVDSSLQPSGVDGNIESIIPRVDTFVVFGNYTVGDCSQFCIYNVTSNSWATAARPSVGTLYGATLWSGDELVIYGDNIDVSGDKYNLVQYSFNDATYTPYTDTGIDGTITSATVGLNDSGDKYLAISWVNSTGHNIQWFDGTSWVGSTSPLGTDSTVSSLSTLPVLSSSGNSSIPLGSSNVLMVNGALNLPGYGNASVASFDGTSWAPLFVAALGSEQGSIASFYSEKQIEIGTPTIPETPKPPRKLLSTGRIVGISFAIAIGCISLLVIIGLIWGYLTQSKQSYQRAPQRVDEKDMAKAAPPQMIMTL